MYVIQSIQEELVKEWTQISGKLPPNSVSGNLSPLLNVTDSWLTSALTQQPWPFPQAWVSIEKLQMRLGYLVLALAFHMMEDPR